MPAIDANVGRILKAGRPSHVIRVRLSGVRRFRFRVWLAMKLLTLASWVAYGKFAIIVDDRGPEVPDEV